VEVIIRIDFSLGGDDDKGGRMRGSSTAAIPFRTFADRNYNYDGDPLPFLP